MKHLALLALLSLLMLVPTACATHKHQNTMTQTTPFQYVVDRFADLEVLRYRVPGFEDLSLNQKLLIYWLSKAAEEGRDILFDQNGAHNIAVRNTLEAIYLNYNGDRTSNEFKAFEVYLKRVLFPTEYTITTDARSSNPDSPRSSSSRHSTRFPMRKSYATTDRLRTNCCRNCYPSFSILQWMPNGSTRPKATTSFSPLPATTIRASHRKKRRNSTIP